MLYVVLETGVYRNSSCPQDGYSPRDESSKKGDNDNRVTGKMREVSVQFRGV